MFAEAPRGAVIGLKNVNAIVRRQGRGSEANEAFFGLARQRKSSTWGSHRLTLYLVQSVCKVLTRANGKVSTTGSGGPGATHTPVDRTRKDRHLRLSRLMRTA